MKKNVESRPTKIASNKKKLNVIRFAKEVKNELKKVVWPTRAQLINNTITVLIACVIVAVIIFLADTAFLGISKAVFG